MARLEPRLTLSALSLTDVEDVFALWSDCEATMLTNWSHTATLDACRSKLGRVLDHYRSNPLHFGPLAIRAQHGRFVGITGADLADAKAGRYDLWYFVRRDEWGKGIATVAVRRLLTLMQDSSRVKVVTAEAVVANVASWRLLQAMGFRRLEHRAAAHARTGADLYVYELRT